MDESLKPYQLKIEDLKQVVENYQYHHAV